MLTAHTFTTPKISLEGSKMEQRQRKSGIDILGDVRWGTHSCLFYNTANDLIDILVPYFKAGLENNEFCMWITSEPLQVEEAKAALSKKVLNLDDYIRKGQIEILDYTEWYTRSGKFNSDEVLQGWVEKEKVALEKGFDGLRLTGNTFWLERSTWGNFNEYEATVDSIIGNNRMLSICSYSLEKCTSSDLIATVSVHGSAIVRKEDSWELIESTKRKQAENTLKESEEFSSSLLNNSPYPILTLNLDTSVSYVNPAFEKLTGFSYAEIAGVKSPDYPWWMKETAEHMSIIKEMSLMLSEALINGVKGRERCFQKKNGERFWVEITGIPVREGDKFKYFLSNWVDITERKQAEEELRIAEGNFRNSIENSPLGIRIGTAEGELLYANKVQLEILGYSSFEELKAIPISKLHTPESYAQHLERVEGRKLGKAVPSSYELSIVRKNGQIRHLIASRKPVVWNGEIQFQVICQDITERKKMEEALRESEEKLRAIFDSLALGVIVSDLDGKILAVNEAKVRMHGYDSKEDLIGQSLFELIAEKDHARVMENRKRRIEQGYTGHAEYTYLRRDGSEFPGEVSNIVFRDASGKPLGIVSITEDITERRQAGEELEKSRQQLRNLSTHIELTREKERTNIAREIHDELGQTLTALKIDLSWLNKRLPKEQEAQIKKTVEMSNLIDTTIQMVKRISTELRPGVLDDLGLTAAIEWQAQEFQERTGINCEAIIKAGDIDIDREMATVVFRIFQEALTNVARHANATRVRVSLKESARQLVLQVRDNGKGITEQQIVHPTSLGLMGIRERVRSWNGSVKINGIPGRGTTIKISIPLGSKEGQDDKNTGR